MRNRGFKNGNFAVLFKRGFFKSGAARSDFIDLTVYFRSFFKSGFNIVFNALEFVFTNIIRFVCGVYFMLLLTKIICEFIYFIDPNADFKIFLFIGKLNKLSRLFALRFKRTDAAFKLAEDIKQAHKIFLRLIKPALSVLSFMAKARNSRGFFKQLTPILILGGND